MSILAQWKNMKEEWERDHTMKIDTDDILRPLAGLSDEDLSNLNIIVKAENDRRFKAKVYSGFFQELTLEEKAIAAHHKFEAIKAYRLRIWPQVSVREAMAVVNAYLGENAVI